MENIDTKNYIKLIENWAKERSLDISNSDKQLIKLQEEVGELAEAHNKEWKDKQIDSLGDIFVVLVVYALQEGLHLDDCIKEAYETISNRKGQLVDGVFVKQEDLNNPHLSSKMSTNIKHKYYDFSEDENEYSALIAANSESEALVDYYEDVVGPDYDGPVSCKQISSTEAWDQLTHSESTDELNLKELVDLFNESGLLLISSELG